MADAVTAQIEAYLGRSAASGEPRWLADLRKAAIGRFRETGYPTRKDELWRFTDLRALMAIPLLPVKERAAPSADVGTYLSEAPAYRLAFVDGRFAPEWSDLGELPNGAYVGAMADALVTRPELVAAAFDSGDATPPQGFAALNAALFDDGFILALDAGVVLDKPVEIVHLGTVSDAAHMRHLIRLGAGARAELIETYAGTGWSNAVTRIELDGGAVLKHLKTARQDEAAFHIALTRADLATDAAYDSLTVLRGGRTSRQDVEARLNGSGARIGLHAATLLRGEQEATFAPIVDHRAPNCRTSKVVKAVIDDNAHGVFLGTVMVRPGADGTDAHQLNRNLLLSDRASVDAKPELTILADDVKCSHGATVGDLDEAALFYLQARGIAPDLARRMLIDAFVDEAIMAAELGESLSAHARTAVAAWLGEAAA